MLACLLECARLLAGLRYPWVERERERERGSFLIAICRRDCGDSKFGIQGFFFFRLLHAFFFPPLVPDHHLSHTVPSCCTELFVVD